MLYSDENAQIEPIENTEAAASEEVELIEGEEDIEESEEDLEEEAEESEEAGQ